MFFFFHITLLINAVSFIVADNLIDDEYSDGTYEQIDTNNTLYAGSEQNPMKVAFAEEADTEKNQSKEKKPHCEYQNSMNEEESDRSTINSYPFSVSIQRKGAHYASGALIDKTWILSSAGAFYFVRESIKLFRARLGSVNCKRYGVIIPIVNFEFHPFYVYGRPGFDVALLRLATPADYSSVIKPIELSRIDAKVLSARFLTTYWPRIIVKGTAIPKTASERTKYNSMRVSTQKLIPWDICVQAMNSLNEALDHSSLCLMPIVSHHSVCMPDVGAPVIADDRLWGITSGWVSMTCPKTPGPTIFTRIASLVVRSWLDAILMDTWQS